MKCGKASETDNSIAAYGVEDSLKQKPGTVANETLLAFLLFISPDLTAC